MLTSVIAVAIGPGLINITFTLLERNACRYNKHMSSKVRSPRLVVITRSNTGGRHWVNEIYIGSAHNTQLCIKYEMAGVSCTTTDSEPDCNHIAGLSAVCLNLMSCIRVQPITQAANIGRKHGDSHEVKMVHQLPKHALMTCRAERSTPPQWWYRCTLIEAHEEQARLTEGRRRSDWNARC